MQEVELYAEVHKDMAASKYTPIARESCTLEKHVRSLRCLSPHMHYPETIITVKGRADFAGSCMWTVSLCQTWIMHVLPTVPWRLL